MQRLMSCDPRALWPGSGMSEITLSCHKFQASRIQAAEKLHCKTNQLRRILDSCEDGRKEGSEERRMFLLVNEIVGFPFLCCFFALNVPELQDFYFYHKTINRYL